jgi:hypothetical protein
MKFKFYALWLSLVCVVVFVLQLLIPGLTDIFILDSGKMIEVWRFASAIFLHGSVMHLISNLFALALFGTILEGLIGGRKFLLVFFASGIAANMVAVWFYPSSLGASGAIYGILGALIILRPMMTVWVSGIPMPMLLAGLVWVAGGVFGLFYPSDIGHIAHLSGMGLGMIFGILFRDWSRKEARKERIMIDEKDVREWEERHMR